MIRQVSGPRTSAAARRVEVWKKQYAEPTLALRARDNYVWFRGLAAVRLPRMLDSSGATLRFERLKGAHVTLDDLVPVAAHLGQVHATAHDLRLHNASLEQEFITDLPNGRRHLIPGFWGVRREAFAQALITRVVPDPLIDLNDAERLVQAASGRPVAFYKDSNPRNLLVVGGASRTPVTVDFDDLTLAPFGYDLAKLVVGLAMTVGRLPEDLISSALAVYNTSITASGAERPPVSMDDFLNWTEIHHVLTSKYLGRGGYRYGWHQVRPDGLGSLLHRRSASITSESET